MENTIKIMLQDEKLEKNETFFSKRQRKIIKLTKSLIAKHKLFDYTGRMSNLYKLPDLVSDEFDKISKLKKLKQSKKISKDRVMLSNKIIKRESELGRLSHKMDNMIQNLYNLEKMDESQSEQDSLYDEFQLILSQLIASEKPIPRLEQLMDQLKTKENLKIKNDLFEKTNSDVKKLDVIIKNIQHKVIEMRHEQNTSELAKKIDCNMSELDDHIKKIMLN